MTNSSSTKGNLKSDSPQDLSQHPKRYVSLKNKFKEAINK